MVIQLLQKHFEKVRTKFKEILTLKGSPHSIALGVAMGFAWNFVPSLGIGPFLAVGTAKLIRCSAVAALAGNLGTGIFIPFKYSMNIITGRFLMGYGIQPSEFEETLYESIHDTITAIEEIVEQPVRFFQLDRLQDFTTDFFIGGFVNALIGGAIMYFIFWNVLSRREKAQKSKKSIDTDGENTDTNRSSSDA